MIPAVCAGMMLAAPPGALGQSSPHGKLEVACEDCHTATSWKELSRSMKFDHGKTGFALAGQHGQVACKQCHETLVFSEAPSKCGDCHKDVHRGELGSTCERCHGSQSWLVPDMPQRHAQTRFPLVGMHQTAPCRACHVNEQKYEYVNVATDCYSCHRTEYEATTVPPHRTVGFGTDCESCHAMTAMRFEGSFDHATTGFALVGAHATVPCASCHTGTRITALATQCMSCHQKDFVSAPDPKHTGFPTDCTTCHTMTAWQPASFDHSRTTFPLVGAHQTVPCASCHVNNNFTTLPTQCYDCHQAQFTSANAPPHTGFPTDCTTCHTTTAWQPASFDHSKTTFPLTGAHQAVACASCHVNNNYMTLPTDCYSCHSSTFASATTPVPHTGFPTNCSTCHTTNAGWSPSTYSHANAVPRFPQDGRHTGAACTKCHQNATNYTIPCCQSSGCHNTCAGGDD
jgi:hypothetical protein